MPRRSQDLPNVARKRFKEARFTYTVIITLAFLCYAVTYSQNTTKTLPQAYQLQFENQWVRVTKVHYGPHEIIPEHAHTQLPVAYVYLNDSGPIIFRHKGWERPELIRPPTKAGSFRLSRTAAVGEIHEVENPTDIPSDFLRVEFKTEPVDRRSLAGRFYREDYPANENIRKVQFENGQIRITRLVCAPHKSLEVAPSSYEPALLVILTAVRFRSIEGQNEVKQSTAKLGQTIWVASGQQQRLENPDDTPMELLRFDFKTMPVKPKEKLRKV
jgi:hypothetical protein